jgi:hypothetical protein
LNGRTNVYALGSIFISTRLCHPLRCLLYRLHSPLFLQRCEMTLLAASVKRVVRSTTLARHTRTGCAHAGTRAAPERNARAFTALRWSARNYPPSRDVSVSRRCMRDLLRNQHKLGALGVIGKKTREQPNRGSPCRLRTRPAGPRHGMVVAQRRRSGQRGRQLVCRRGDRMAAGTLGSRASHTPSARIARSPRARCRCRQFIVLDADLHEKARWRWAALVVPGLS